MAAQLQSDVESLQIKPSLPRFFFSIDFFLRFAQTAKKDRETENDNENMEVIVEKARTARA